MDPLFEKKYHAMEEDYYWFRARRDIILRLLSDFPRELRVIDIGCSGGALMGDLSRKGFRDIIGVDISNEAISECHRRGYSSAVVADAQHLPFPDNTFDMLIASDILEHTDDEGVTLREWRRVLKTGGRAFIFVPAHMYLWSDHDVVNHHRKRYSKSEFLQALCNNGFKLARIGYWNFFLFVPAVIVRFFNGFMSSHKNIKQRDNLYSVNYVLNALLFFFMKIENKILASGVSVPIGVSLFSVVQKQS